MTTQPWRPPPQHDAQPTVGADALLAVLDALDTGVMVCDARGRLLMHNHAAGCELAGGGLLRLGPDNLLDVSGGTGLLALRRAVHGAAFDHSHRLVPLCHGEQCLMLAVQPLRCDGGATPLVLLLTGRRGLCPDLAVHHVGRVYALTPAELSVLTNLLAGVRIGDMASARGVKLSTVRTQVAALRAKLDRLPRVGLTVQNVLDGVACAMERFGVRLGPWLAGGTCSCRIAPDLACSMPAIPRGCAASIIPACPAPPHPPPLRRRCCRGRTPAPRWACASRSARWPHSSSCWACPLCWPLRCASSSARPRCARPRRRCRPSCSASCQPGPT